MFNIIKSAISAGNYKLSDMQHKIKKMHILGDLTEDQMDELLNLASSVISHESERPETLQMIQYLSMEIETIKTRLKLLEDQGANTLEYIEEDAYPEWKPWSGFGNNYQKDAIISHNGELWQSVFDGQNVWEPGIPGTENMWVKYISE